MTNIHKLARRVTEQYLAESHERADAAERAALMRQALEQGANEESMAKFYSDDLIAQWAVEFVTTAGNDPSFGAMAEFMERKYKEMGERD